MSQDFSVLRTFSFSMRRDGQKIGPRLRELVLSQEQARTWYHLSFAMKGIDSTRTFAVLLVVLDTSIFARARIKFSGPHHPCSQRLVSSSGQFPPGFGNASDHTEKVRVDDLYSGLTSLFNRVPIHSDERERKVHRFYYFELFQIQAGIK